MELTDQDREEIQNQIAEYKANQPTQRSVAALIAPNGNDAAEDLNRIITEESIPNRRENRKFRKKIRSIWNKWRNTTLDAKALEEEKIACQIEIERAETKQKLAKIRRGEELAEAQHWLTLNKGNLEDIDANTTSKPNMFWYNIRRGCHHITKLTNNIPKIIKNLFWIGAIIVGLVLLKHFNVL